VRPAGRLAAAIDLLTEVDGKALPADGVAARYFRYRRYIGAKDRTWIGALVFAVLRRRGELLWRLAQAGGCQSNARALCLALLGCRDGLALADLEALCDGSRHAPMPLTASERRWLATLPRAPLPADAPPAARLNVPEWLVAPLARQFGDRLAVELAALDGRAPLDLRVNTLKADPPAVRAALAELGIAAEPTHMSPVGLRIQRPVRVTDKLPFRAGWVEVQDEGSQLIALLTAARAGHRVVDYCAGAGGKSLAIAAAMGNAGIVHALDTVPGRLARIGERAHRAGIDIIRANLVAEGPAEAERDLVAACDRVLVDAPCSGSGAWRRNPGERWRLDPARLAALTAAQRAILTRAATLVRLGGRLIYATCSILPAENVDNAEWFLSTHGDFTRQDAGAVWRAVIGRPCAAADEYLQLTPAAHGTDGFFVAIFARREG